MTRSRDKPLLRREASAARISGESAYESIRNRLRGAIKQTASNLLKRLKMIKRY
jgi:hypothetical protein